MDSPQSDGCAVCARMATMPGDERWIGDVIISHCRDCHAVWKRATNTNHCVRCHLTFIAPSVLDDHQPFGPCVPPESVGLIGVENQWGTTVWRRELIAEAAS